MTESDIYWCTLVSIALLIFGGIHLVRSAWRRFGDWTNQFTDEEWKEELKKITVKVNRFNRAMNILIGLVCLGLVIFQLWAFLS